MNTFGHLFRLTTFGESHGPGIGGVVDGMPAGIEIDLDFIQEELNRRRPGQSKLTTSRKEGDRVELLSGVFEGRSTGCPIGFLVRNENQHSDDYDNLRKYAKKTVSGGDVLFLPALNFLYLMGLIDYRPKTDAVEYVGPNETV